MLFEIILLRQHLARKTMLILPMGRQIVDTRFLRNAYYIINIAIDIFHNIILQTNSNNISRHTYIHTYLPQTNIQLLQYKINDYKNNVLMMRNQHFWDYQNVQLYCRVFTRIFMNSPSSVVLLLMVEYTYIRLKLGRVYSHYQSTLLSNFKLYTSDIGQ